MTNKKSTKRALLLSVLSLVLCFSMLVGTTFAWFTDSVTSANNVIQSGNLDITLEYYNGTEWKDVQGSSEILDEEALWEPGYTEVAYFRIKNNGSLALKYQFGVNIVSETEGVNMAGTSYKLSDYIYFDVVEDQQPSFADRAAAMANATETTKISAGYAKAGTLTATDGYVYLAMVIYMPETVGNDANARSKTETAKIELGINIFATQVTNESDAFGPDYDTAAPIISETVARPTAGEGVALNSSVVEGGLSVDLPAAVVDALPAEVTDIAIAATAPVVDQANNTLTFSELTVVDQDGKEIDLSNNTTPVTVTLNVANVYANGDVVVIYHDGVAVASAIVTDGTITYETAHFCEVVVSALDSETAPAFVNDEDGLRAAIANGGYYIIANNIDVDADNTMTVPADKAVVLDLNGFTIAGVSDDADKNDDGKLTSADNEVMIDVRGTLTVKNGTMTIKHESDNFGWNACTEVFYVAFNGTLNVENATIENLGGSDMAYAIDLVNADAKTNGITVNVTNSTIKSSYIAVRVFNNGSGKNNVTIEDTELIGTSRALWVHIYSDKDNGGKGVKDATLNLDFFGNGNTFTANNPERIIEFGFDDAINFDANGRQYVTATTLAEVMAYAKNGNVIIDAQGANLGDFDYDGTFGNGTVLKNAKFTYVYGASVDGVATFENCEFVSDHSYSANFSDGSYTGEVIFNNCYFDGWSSFGDAITSVEMNNCTFDWNNPYSMLRFYQNAQLNNCEFVDIDGIDTNKTGTVVELNNCTGIEGKIYNNTENGVVKEGTWIVDGVELTDVPAW